LKPLTALVIKNNQSSRWLQCQGDRPKWVKTTQQLSIKIVVIADKYEEFEAMNEQAILIAHGDDASESFLLPSGFSLTLVSGTVVSLTQPMELRYLIQGHAERIKC
jgi:ribonucleotide reductase beta subunit family protein with ferritin-like domain